LARFALGGAARGGRFFGAMSDVLRTAQSVRRRAWRMNAIVLAGVCSLCCFLLSEARCSLSQKLVSEVKALRFSVCRAMAWPQ
jgi:hypothetical protein